MVMVIVVKVVCVWWGRGEWVVEGEESGWWRVMGGEK